MAITTFDTRTEIETPESVVLTFDVAGPGSRLVAYLIDLIIRVAVAWGMMWAMSFTMPLFGDGLPVAFFLLGLFLLEWGYTTVFEGMWHGQTPGKRIFHLRVVKDAGYPINFYDATLRNLLRAADILPIGYGVGLICMGSTKRLQRIGDLVAGTIVVRDEQHRFERNTSVFDRLEPLQPNECSRLFSVSERTLDVVEQLLWRRETLARRRVEEIARILADPIAENLGYDLSSQKMLDPNVFFLRRVLRTFSTIEKTRPLVAPQEPSNAVEPAVTFDPLIVP